MQLRPLRKIGSPNRLALPTDLVTDYDGPPRLATNRAVAGLCLDGASSDQNMFIFLNYQRISFASTLSTSLPIFSPLNNISRVSGKCF